MSAFLTIAVIHALAVMSPGPDFAIISRNSLMYSRRIGLWTAAGIAAGLMVHTIYSLFGIGLLIAQSVILFSIIKYIGAGYLIYIGWKSLYAQKQNVQETLNQSTQAMSPWQAWKNGFLCNVLNPKATLFILALFTQVIEPSTPMIIQALYGMYMSVATFVWFAGIASVFSLENIRKTIRNIQHIIERTMGAILIGLGIKIALSSHE